MTDIYNRLDDALGEIRRMRAALDQFVDASKKSAPASGASDNSGQRDPSEMPDSSGADTAVTNNNDQ